MNSGHFVKLEEVLLAHNFRSADRLSVFTLLSVGSFTICKGVHFTMPLIMGTEISRSISTFDFQKG